MKKILYSVVAIATLSSAYAGVIESTKVMTNKVLIDTGLKDTHIQNVSFEEVYKKAFYKKSNFTYIVTASTVAAAVAFSYVTAGAGAPVAATGVSTVASAIGGGGAGTYMAGLSTVGGVFGGNAVLGGAILNGISIGTIGGTTTGMATVAAKIPILLEFTSSVYDGINYFKNPDTKQLLYKVRLSVPKGLGNKRIRELVDTEHDAIEKIFELTDELKKVDFKDKLKFNELQDRVNDYNKMRAEVSKEFIVELKKILKQPNSLKTNQEDLLVLGIIAYNDGDYVTFSKAVQILNQKKTDRGFIDYLCGIEALIKNDLEKSKKYLHSSIVANEYALESALLLSHILSTQNFNKHEKYITQLMEYSVKNFDQDKYQTFLTKTTAYYRLGTFFYKNLKFKQAAHYFEKAQSEYSLIQEYFGDSSLLNQIKISRANACYQARDLKQASSVFTNLMESSISSDEKTKLRQQYIGASK
jgi:tetratricopeptide (TPR) repeat protein